MSQPYSLTRQILTTAGQVEELPIGALRLPPPVGFQAVCGGVGGGLCLWESICYIGATGLTICSGAIVPIICVTIAITVGVLVIQICENNPEAAFSEGMKLLDAWYFEQKALCEALSDEEEIQPCLRELKDHFWALIQELQKKCWPRGGRGPVRQGGGINGSNIYEA